MEKIDFAKISSNFGGRQRCRTNLFILAVKLTQKIDFEETFPKMVITHIKLSERIIWETDIDMRWFGGNEADIGYEITNLGH